MYSDDQIYKVQQYSVYCHRSGQNRTLGTVKPVIFCLKIALNDQLIIRIVLNNLKIAQ